MQAVNETGYPMKVKRFYSYSMTPFDSELQPNNTTNIPESNMINKKINTDNIMKRQSKKCIQSFQYKKTYQFNKRQPRITDIYTHIQQNQTKINSNIITINNLNNIYHNLDYSLNYQSTDNFKTTSSTFVNKNFNDYKSIKTSPFSYREINRKSNIKMNIDTNQKQITSKLNTFISKNQNNQKAQTKIKIPSFILNKKKKNQIQNQIHNSQEQTARFSNSLQKKLNQNHIEIDKSSLQNNIDEKRIISFKKLKNNNTGEIFCSLKIKSLNLNSSNKNQSIQKSNFYPPTNSKISFSKATASTLYTQLQRQQSIRTLKDFEQMDQQKSITNSLFSSEINEQTNKNGGLFNIKQGQISGINGVIKVDQKQRDKKVNNQIQNQINILFSSDDDSQRSQQYNQELQDQLQQLF